MWPSVFVYDELRDVIKKRWMQSIMGKRAVWPGPVLLWPDRGYLSLAQRESVRSAVRYISDTELCALDGADCRDVD